MDDDGLGDAESATESSCNRPDNHVIYSNDIDDNCPCFNNDESCYDCNGICGGTSVAAYVCPNEKIVCNATDCILSIDIPIIPQDYIISSYPNPFNPVVTVSFAIPELGFVSIGVFDVRGQKLATLANQNYQPGNYTVNWNASANATGVYFISLMISNTRLTQKVLLLK